MKYLLLLMICVGAHTLSAQHTDCLFDSEPDNCCEPVDVSLVQENEPEPTAMLIPANDSINAHWVVYNWHKEAYYPVVFPEGLNIHSGNDWIYLGHMDASAPPLLLIWYSKPDEVDFYIKTLQFDGVQYSDTNKTTLNTR